MLLTNFIVWPVYFILKLYSYDSLYVCNTFPYKNEILIAYILSLLSLLSWIDKVWVSCLNGAESIFCQDTLKYSYTINMKDVTGE